MAQRILSFLPSATEMVFALGVGDRLLGVTHECDYPPEARQKPVVVSPVLPVAQMSEREIDQAVTERLRDGLSLYRVDEARVKEIAPDLIITQDLCQVCAPSGNEIAELLKTLARKPEILWMTPRSLDGVFQNIRDLGKATGREREADRLIEQSRARLQRIAAETQSARRPRVFCMEWIDPVYCSGHWVPEIVEIAGGEDRLGRRGTDSVRIAWDEVREWAPEILVVMPCGFDGEKAVSHAKALFGYSGFGDLPAARHDKIYAVDANAYFARPGPRLVEGTELLAHLIHPDLFPWNGPASAFRKLAFAGAA